jgi:hypothetical protein
MGSIANVRIEYCFAPKIFSNYLKKFPNAFVNLYSMSVFYILAYFIYTFNWILIHRDPCPPELRFYKNGEDLANRTGTYYILLRDLIIKIDFRFSRQLLQRLRQSKTVGSFRHKFRTYANAWCSNLRQSLHYE